AYCCRKKFIFVMPSFNLVNTGKVVFQLALVMLLCVTVQAQQYDIVIKGGSVIDPKNNINSVMDVAIHDGKIAAVSRNIDAGQARQVVNAKGMYVVPGLIDIHAHVFHGTEEDHAYSNGFWA